MWAKGVRHLDNLWNIFRNEYMLALRERYQRYLKGPRVESKLLPTKGQIVHVKDKGPRGTWKIAKIKEVLKSSDDVARSAKIVLASGGTVVRPLNLLYPLEIEMPEKYPNVTNVDNKIDKNEAVSAEKEKSEIGSSKRRAGIIAREKLSNLLRNEEVDGNN